MDRRGLLVGGLAAVLCPAAAHGQDISQKTEEIMPLLNSGKYPRYRDTQLADVIIHYEPRFSAEDWTVIFDIGGRREIHTQTTIRAGLSKEMIIEYAKRKNVKKIVPNFSNYNETLH